MAVNHAAASSSSPWACEQVGVGGREPHPGRVARRPATAGSGRPPSALSSTSRAAASSPRSSRAPASTMRSSTVSSASGFVGERLGDEPQGDVGAAQGPLAVGEDRAVALVAAHPAVGPDLAGGLGEVAGVVRGDADGLADRRDPGGAVAGGSGVGEGGLGVLVDRLPAATRWAGDALGVARVEAAQRARGRRGRARGGPPTRGSPDPAAAADGGPHGRRTGAGRSGRSPDGRARGPPARCGRSPWGRRSCHCGRSPVRPVTLRTAVAATGRAGLPASCGRSPRGRRSCHVAARSSRPLRTVAAADGGPATAGGRPAGAVAAAGAPERCGRSPCGRRSCHCGRSPVGRSPCGRRSCHVTRGGRTCGRSPADGHPADGGPATSAARSPRCGRSPCGRRSCHASPRRPVTLRPRPTAADGHPADGGPATADDRRWDGHPADDGPASRAGHPTLRTVTLRTTVLPLRPITGGPIARAARPSAADGHPADGGPGHRALSSRTATPRPTRGATRPVALRHGDGLRRPPDAPAGAPPRGRQPEPPRGRRSHREERRIGPCRRSCVRLRSRGCRAARRNRVAVMS